MASVVGSWCTRWFQRRPRPRGQPWPPAASQPLPVSDSALLPSEQEGASRTFSLQHVWTDAERAEACFPCDGARDASLICDAATLDSGICTARVPRGHAPLITAPLLRSREETAT